MAEEGVVLCHWHPICEPECAAVAQHFVGLCQVAVGNDHTRPDPRGWLPVSHLLMLLVPKAKFSCQGPRSAVLRLSLRVRALPREQINRTMFEPLVLFNVIWGEIYVS